eukprot:gnl/Dysnectes_brevis/205_a234_1232.p1 GENE.gnl/Dysnectes_brevis/205_a234_1232~~gnl/Dysnectes_brevis/205_a234_1232.p1  ORF type:complete len:330 (+),score=69.70 gnl/Dysnectes_brevis/205_a234_1232:315-1304(+)
MFVSPPVSWYAFPSTPYRFFALTPSHGINPPPPCDHLTSVEGEITLTDVTDISEAFSGCSSLIQLDLSSWDTSSVTNFSEAFAGCSNLTNLDISTWDTSNADSDDMCLDCPACTPSTMLLEFTIPSDSLYISFSVGVGQYNGLINWGDGETTIANIFASSQAQPNALFTHSYVTEGIYRVTIEGDYPGFKIQTGKSMLTRVLRLGNTGLTALSFYGCDQLISVEGFADVSAVTDLTMVFQYCTMLESLDIADWDTSHVTTMEAMFKTCSSLTSIDIADWDTSNTIDMDNMFSGCSSLTTPLPLSGWDTSSLQSSDGMCDGCPAGMCTPF